MYNSLRSVDLLMVKSLMPFAPKVTDFDPSTLTVYLESFYLAGSNLTYNISDFSLNYLGLFSTSTVFALQVLHTKIDGFLAVVCFSSEISSVFIILI